MLVAGAIFPLTEPDARPSPVLGDELNEHVGNHHHGCLSFSSFTPGSSAVNSMPAAFKVRSRTSSCVIVMFGSPELSSARLITVTGNFALLASLSGPQSRSLRAAAI